MNDFKQAFDLLTDQAVEGAAQFLLAAYGFSHLDKPRTWWQRYTQFTGAGQINARCRKILLAQIDAWTPNEGYEG